MVSIGTACFTDRTGHSRLHGQLCCRSALPCANNLSDVPPARMTPRFGVFYICAPIGAMVRIADILTTGVCGGVKAQQCIVALLAES